MGTNILGQVILNRFRIDEFVEAGGMGAVYRVWDLTRNVPLAMKVLHDDYREDPVFWKRFEREAEALKTLAHPNIVPFYGLFQTSDFGFFLEYFIDGPSLKNILRSRKGLPFPISTTLSILKALCASLGYAHHNGIVHCDIKPGNVLIDRGGNIYLTDFGVARHSNTQTSTMAGAGTPAYMAPEQIRGEAVSPASDIYALGVLLFELLTGQRPFRGNEAETEHLGESTDQRICYAHLHLPPPRPSTLNPGLPGELSHVILKALAKDPSARFQNTQEFFYAVCSSLGMGPSSLADRVDLSRELQYSDRNDLDPNPIVQFTPPPITPTVVTSRPGGLKPNLALIIFGGGLLSFLGVAALVGVFFFVLPRLGFLPGRQDSGTPEALPTQVSTEVISDQLQTPTEASQVRPTIEKASLSVTATRPPAIFTPTRVVSKFKSPLYLPIPGCAASHIHLDDWVMITYGGGRNAIRSTPDTHPTDNRIGYAEEGELIHIIGGPECNYGWLLWNVRTASGIEGWTPETDGTRFFLEPFPSWPACANSLPSLLHKDDQARVTQYPPLSNRLRSLPGINGERIGSANPGDLLTVLDGPECKDGYVWWQVEMQNGLTGWTAEGDTASYFLVPVPKPH